MPHYKYYVQDNGFFSFHNGFSSATSRWQSDNAHVLHAIVTTTHALSHGVVSREIQIMADIWCWPIVGDLHCARKKQKGTPFDNALSLPNLPGHCEVKLEGRKGACMNCSLHGHRNPSGRTPQTVYGCDHCGVHLCRSGCFSVIPHREFTFIKSFLYSSWFSSYFALLHTFLADNVYPMHNRYSMTFKCPSHHTPPSTYQKLITY